MRDDELCDALLHDNENKLIFYIENQLKNINEIDPWISLIIAERGADMTSRTDPNAFFDAFNSKIDNN